MFYFGSIDFCISFLGKGEDFLSLFLGERRDIDFCIYFWGFCISFLGKRVDFLYFRNSHFGSIDLRLRNDLQGRGLG